MACKIIPHSPDHKTGVVVPDAVGYRSLGAYVNESVVVCVAAACAVFQSDTNARRWRFNV